MNQLRLVFKEILSAKTWMIKIYLYPQGFTIEGKYIKKYHQK